MFLTFLVFGSVFSSFLLQWLIYKHQLKEIYLTMIAQGTIGIVLNTILVAKSPDQWSLSLFVATSLWQSLIGLKAYIKHQEKKL